MDYVNEYIKSNSLDLNTKQCVYICDENKKEMVIKCINNNIIEEYYY